MREFISLALDLTHFNLLKKVSCVICVDFVLKSTL